MSKSSIQIHNELRDLENKISKASEEFGRAEGDAKDALRDSINQFKGEQNALNEQLHDVLEAEDAMRRNGGVPIAGGTPENKFAPKTMAEFLLGPRDEYKPLAFGQKLTYNVKNASDAPYTNMGLPGIEQVDYSLPRQTSDYAGQFGFMDSLPKGTTTADTLYFFQKDEAKYKNAAAEWTAGNEKASSAMGWVKASAEVKTYAHLMPVLEQQLKDWPGLRSMIDTELLVGLRLVEAKGAVSSVLAETGIQKYTAASGDDIVDSMRKMKTDILLKTGFNPTHVAMHPYVAEQLELMKDDNGRYIQQVINGKVWALAVTEDVNLATTSGSSTTYGMLAYWNGAATWFTKETDSIAVGLVGNQFAYNEATIRAEGRHALKVTYPKAFAYLADTGVKGR